MKVKALPLIVALIFCLPAPAQENALLRDSLERALKHAATDTARVNIMNKLSNAWKHSDVQRTAEYAQQALDLARAIGYAPGECKAMNMLGLAAYRLGRYAEAIEHLRAATTMAQTIADSTILNYANGNLGLVYMKLGDLPTALAHYQRQLDIVKAVNDSLSLYRILTNIGLLHRRANNEQEAISYMRDALRIAQAIGDMGNTASVLHNLATGLDNTGQRDSAKTLYEQALQMNKVVGNERFQATNHSALAMIFLEEDDHHAARAHADTSLMIRERLGNLAEIGMAHGVLAGVLHATGDRKGALEHMETSLRLATEVGDLENMLESMQALARHLGDMGRYKEAAYWFGEHINLRDSLDQQEVTDKLARMQVAYDVAQKDARIAALAEEERQQRALSELRQQQRDLLLMVAIALALLVAFTIAQVVRIRRLNKELAQARDRAERNERSMDLFLSIMGHEVRSPMSAAISSLNMARTSSTEEVRERYLDISERSMRGLLRIVNDLLDRSAIEAGTLRIDRVSLVPIEVLRNAAQPFEALASSKGIELLVELDGSLVTPRLGDPGRLNQVITNLLGNAVKYTDRGRITVSARTDGDAGIVLRVADTGRGMSAAEREKLFMPFHRLGKEHRSDPGGTGLGLYITAMLVQRMGGRIEVESSPGEGTVFTVQLPMPVDRMKGPLHIDDGATGPPQDGSILFVVDDDPHERKRSVTVLQELDPTATIMETGQGEELLQLLDRCAANLDGAIVFTDLDMPHMTGFELVNRIKNGPFAHIPCVAVSSSVLVMDVAELHALGFATVLSKPLDGALLSGLIKELKPAQAPGVALP